MAAVDFITVLGRVLHDGTVRDAFAADPVAFVRQLGLSERDQSMFLRLAPADLEFQARVLLRKRFVLVREVLPLTCERLGTEAWPEFARYGRGVAPKGNAQTAEDAFGFSRHLLRLRSDALCLIEFNRCRFVYGRKQIAVHMVPLRRSSWLPALQVLRRKGPGHWNEWMLYLAP